MQTLFDENGLLNISDIVTNNPAYQAIMADGIVTDQELKEQADATMASLRHLQSILNDEQQAAVGDAISQMSVLFAAYHNHELQNLK